MSLGRHRSDGLGRDIEQDFLDAYLAEYRSYLTVGQVDKAAEVADVLRTLGVELEPVEEVAIPADDLQKAVPAKRGRPRKAE